MSANCVECGGYDGIHDQECSNFDPDVFKDLNDTDNPKERPTPGDPLED